MAIVDYSAFIVSMILRLAERKILTVISKPSVFGCPTQIIGVREEVNNLDFVAIEQ